LLGIPHATVTTRGFKWELTQAKLSFPGNTSCFNRNAQENIVVNVEEGNVLMLIYDDV